MTNTVEKKKCGFCGFKFTENKYKIVIPMATNVPICDVCLEKEDKINIEYDKDLQVQIRCNELHKPYNENCICRHCLKALLMKMYEEELKDSEKICEMLDNLDIIVLKCNDAKWIEAKAYSKYMDLLKKFNSEFDETDRNGSLNYILHTIQENEIIIEDLKKTIQLTLENKAEEKSRHLIIKFAERLKSRYDLYYGRVW